jgi:hypothetical protein
VPFNTTFAFSATAQPTYVSGSDIGHATSITLPPAVDLTIQIVPSVYLGNPNNVPGLAPGETVSFSPGTITIAGGGSGPTSLPDFSFFGPGFLYTFTPTTGVASHSPGGDNLDITFVGTVTGPGFSLTASALTLGFTQSGNQVSTISTSGSFEAPPSSITLPDGGTSLALLGAGIIGLASLRRRM